MNYEKIYYQIIEKRKSVPLQHNEYGEIHHIIPRSLGGDDSDINLVKLTAREHYLCHALLSEMYDVGTFEWYKMNHAFAMMRNSTTKQNRYFNSKLFELKRNDFSKALSYNQLGDRNSQFGTCWITNGTENKKIKSIDLNNFQENGWKLGRNIKNEKTKKEKIKYDSTVYVDGLVIKKYQQNKILEIFKIVPTENGIRLLGTKLNELYNEQKLSTNQIAKTFNTSNETIRNYLKLFGIKLRSLSESIKIRL